MADNTINSEILKYLNELPQAKRIDVLGYVKSLLPRRKKEALTKANKQFLSELEGAVKELNLVKEGNVKLQSAKGFMDEL